MKLKSLLLGSAAVLALSTGAQAADPIVEFVSLGVCDTYGITGLTIESDDTCLSISGEVAYTWTGSNFDAGPDLYDSEVEWDLAFEATTQTDAGAAVAHISFNEAGTASDDVELNEAYVSFGDTTVLSAGKIDSLYDTEVLDRTYGGDEWGFFDWDLDEGELNAARADGRAVGRDGHGIQISSLVADGFRVMASLEDLESTGPDAGTATLGVAYDNAGISAEVAVLLGDLYDDADLVNYYANITAEFDAFEVRGAVLADDTGYFIASVGASATLDMFTLDADAYFTEDDDWGVAGEGSFDATDTVAIYLGAGFQEVATVEIFTVYGGVDVDVTETLTANAELGYTDVEGATDYIYGAGGLTYAPGGGFETGINLYANTEDDYKFSFEASKEF